MPTISYTIMAHPKREKWAEELGVQLDAEVVYDRKNNIWDTCRRSWLANDFSKEYSAVIQDDAILCADFKQKARQMIAGADGDHVYSFYSADYKPLVNQLQEAEKQGKDHTTTQFIYNEIALCMKSEHVEEMVHFCDEFEPMLDHQINNWALQMPLRIYHPVESLVEHRDEESLYRQNTDRSFKRSGERVAYQFKGTQT